MVEVKFQLYMCLDTEQECHGFLVMEKNIQLISMPQCGNIIRIKDLSYDCDFQNMETEGLRVSDAYYYDDGTAVVEAQIDILPKFTMRLVRELERLGYVVAIGACDGREIMKKIQHAQEA